MGKRPNTAGMCLLLMLGVGAPGTGWAGEATASSADAVEGAAGDADLQAAAERGDAEAQYRLGVRYLYGEGAVPAPQAALRWLRRAGEQGQPDAELLLGEVYHSGIPGVAPDFAEAFRWRQAAARRGDAEAQYFLGAYFHLGAGVARDDAAGAQWWLRAAEQGHAEAQLNLGDLHYYGQGARQDYAEAARWWQRAAEGGNARAQYALATLHYEGRGVPQDRAAAARWWRSAADQGYAKAFYRLGALHAKGEGVPRDPGEAYRLLSAAAARLTPDDPELDLAVQLRDFLAAELGDAAGAVPGRGSAAGGGAVDPEQSALAWRKVAEAGNPQAQHTLGELYHRGRGVPQDDAEAVRWWLRAARQGMPRSQLQLAVAYSEGRGVPRDDREALRWVLLAIGDQAVIEHVHEGPQPGEIRDDSRSRLSEEAIREVQEWVARWRPERERAPPEP